MFPGFFVLSLTFNLVSGAPRSGGNSRTSCRPIPGDPEWPSTKLWNSLNDTVDGRLIATIPLPSVCHTGAPFNNYNEESCNALRLAWTNDQTLLAHSLFYLASFADMMLYSLRNPAEIMNPYTQNYSCVPYTAVSRPCSLGNYASYSINVSRAEDVIAGIKFARQNNVRLVIKNTGHDFLGKSTGKGSLSIWTHYLNTTEIIEKYNGDDYTGPAARLGAGVVGGEVYRVVGNAGYRILGGTCPTVGLAGGYASGAGHSLLNGEGGMAADAVLEWEVVTADGNHLIATPKKNADLYWALSGGGPGTFAVVLSMTTKIFADGPIGSGIMTFNMSSTDSKNYWEAIQDLWAFLPQFVDAGPNTWDFSLTPSGFQAYAITVPDKTANETEALLRPYLDKLTERGIAYSYIPTYSQNYLEYFSSRFGPGVAGAGPATVQLASRLIPRSGVLDVGQNAKIVESLKAFTDAKSWMLGCHALNVKNASHPENAVLPQWRSAIATCNIVSYWDWNITEVEMAAQSDYLVNTLMPQLEAATPGAGTYLNEVNAQWKGDWITELYGTNYERLLHIKNKYDPDHVFYAYTAIGSASWAKDESGRICRVSTP